MIKEHKCCQLGDRSPPRLNPHLPFFGAGEGVCVQASTLGSLEALLEFLKGDKVAIPVSAINIGPVHKRDVMRANVMNERGNKKFGVILAFDVPGEARPPAAGASSATQHCSAHPRSSIATATQSGALDAFAPQSPSDCRLILR